MSLSQRWFICRAAGLAACVLALLLSAASAGAWSPQAVTATAALPAPAKPPAAPPGISFAGGQLSIDALDATLADVLDKVAGLTGVKIDVPAEALKERMPVVKLGPGPPRQVLVSLLGDLNFEWMWANRFGIAP